jgi:hypothetical protein
MNKFKSICVTLYHTAALSAIGFISWKIVKFWHAGIGEKTGRTIDASIGATAVKLEENAIALETASDKGVVENLGKGIDTVLTDTKKSLENATNLVKRALKR